ncbi:unnamed protein product [Calypogeia fissa]
MAIGYLLGFLDGCIRVRRQRQRQRHRQQQVPENVSSNDPHSLDDHIMSIPPAEGILPLQDFFDLKDHRSVERIFKMKRSWLQRELAKKRGVGEGAPQPNLERSDRRRLRIYVERDNVFKGSYVQFRRLSNEDLQNPLSIVFSGEAGVDTGGITRDWYSTLSKEIFNLDYGLFMRSAADDYTFRLNPNSGVNPDHLELFQFIGTIVGKALSDGCLINGHFTRVLYKRLLNKSPTYHDLATIDVQVYKSLVWLLENNLDERDLGLTFVVDREYFGAYDEIELKPNGKEINVCEANKKEYVDLLSQWHLQDSIELQFQALNRGLARVIDPTLLQYFDERELEWLMGGFLDIDVLDWRKNTSYSWGYSDKKKCKIIRWFWELVESWSPEKRAQLLQFVTGTSKLPYPEGFKGLSGAEGFNRFRIVRIEDSTRLPQAHTCYNQLMLPEYGSFEELAYKLETAILESGNRFHLL